MVLSGHFRFCICGECLWKEGGMAPDSNFYFARPGLRTPLAVVLAWVFDLVYISDTLVLTC